MNINILFYPIFLPIVTGFLNLLAPELYIIQRGILVLGTLFNFLISLFIFLTRPQFPDIMHLDGLSSLILLTVTFLGFLISLYSVKFFNPQFNFRKFAAYVFWTIGAASGLCLIKDLRIFIIFWVIIALTLFLLIKLSPETKETIKKSSLISVTSSLLLICGIVLFGITQKTWLIPNDPLPIKNLNLITFLLITLAAFIKIGVIPFDNSTNNWILNTAKKASVPVNVLLPVVFDKLIGIYLLTRIITNIFVHDKFVIYFFLLIGSIIIIITAIKALLQHNLKTALSYDFLSQAGYMIIGIGSGNFFGVLGGLFHLVNNVIYNTILFFTSGSIEKQIGSSQLEDLGGISKVMPITFFTSLIAALSISGIPPFNGFVSKWLIYQGLIQSIVTNKSLLALMSLIITLFGSALTLASLIKLIHASFLTSAKKVFYNIKEVPWQMWLPSLVLAVFCIVLGIFAFKIPFPYLVPKSKYEILAPSGQWEPLIATALIILGLTAGLLIYIFILRLSRIRTDNSFVGGEDLAPENYPSGAEFYQTIKEIKFLKFFYK